MKLVKFRQALVCAALAIAMSSAAVAPSYAQSQKLERRLIRMSEILGAMHFLRGACYRPEKAQWRSSFDELIRMQRPSQALRNMMNDAFYGSYNFHQRTYGGCTGATAIRASKLADEGERLSRKLANAYDDSDW